MTNEQGTRDYNKKVIFKTITTLFLCAYLKLRYSAKNTAEINADKIADNVLSQPSQAKPKPAKTKPSWAKTL